MNISTSSKRQIVCALIAGALLAGCATDPRTPSPELLQRIEAASTRQEHESLAAHFEREAAAARAIAVDHRKMAKSYTAVAGRGGASMQAHCYAIVQKYDGVAADFDAMAAAHKQMAGTATR